MHDVGRRRTAVSRINAARRHIAAVLLTFDEILSTPVAGNRPVVADASFAGHGHGSSNRTQRVEREIEKLRVLQNEARRRISESRQQEADWLLREESAIGQAAVDLADRARKQSHDCARDAVSWEAALTELRTLEQNGLEVLDRLRQSS